jgi:UDP-N-acetylmuramoyl-L-alanyl-D-glutamate--2,6-diaminopimelate ligase
MKLKDLLLGVNVIGSNTSWQEFDVPAISCDSRSELPKVFLFMAIDGEETDGHKYIPMAIQKGAGVILVQRST